MLLGCELINYGQRMLWNCSGDLLCASLMLGVSLFVAVAFTFSLLPLLAIPCTFSWKITASR